MLKNGRALRANSVQALHRQKNTWHTKVKNYSMTFINYNHAWINWLPCLYLSYKHGLNTHKDTNNAQIKINIEMSLF